MRVFSRKGASRVLCLGLACLLCIASFPLTIRNLANLLAIPAQAAEVSTYVAPAYAVDFSTYEGVDHCTGLYHVSTSLENHVMRISFQDNGQGVCDDPYLSLPTPGNVNFATHHFLALLVRTDKQDLRGEIRFRTTTTGDSYPCLFFTYEKTDDWQLILLDLSDLSKINYAPSSIQLAGTLTNLRLDMFNNSCPSDTVYEIKAMGLYDNAEDAATFLHFSSAEDQKQQELPQVDYSSFWRGEAFATPALSTRMRWVTYGFTDPSPIDQFLRQGYGGVVSNVLFRQNYLLDQQQFRTLAEAYRYAAEKGMSTWIYDEYQWPSGKAFGQVLEGHDELEATGIQHHTLTGTGGTASYTCQGKDIRIMQAVLTDAEGQRTLALGENVRRVQADASGAYTLDVYVLRYTFEGVENRNDFTTLRHVDLLNKDAVARFLMLTHERYKQYMGDAFAHVEAFFTDEPQLGNRGMTGYVVWTPGMDTLFRETYGYDVHLPSLFSGDSDEDRICRMNYFQLVAKLFKQSYVDQMSAWCEANGTLASGHFLFEENMNEHVETYGGDFLQIVGSMSMPGLDLLWVDPTHLMSRNSIGSAVGIRYVASAAKNASKRRVMVEYNPDAANTLSKTDPLGESIGGVTISRLLGCTDYNVINPQASYTYDQIQTLNQYLGRLNTLLEGSVECGQVAVFYPIATVQALYDADTGHTSETGSQGASIRLDTNFQTLCRNLLQAQYLYTVIDDQSLRTATVASDGCLCIGDGAYKVIILPMTQYISVEALQTLVTFRAAGGTVIFAGDTPVHGLAPHQEEAIAMLMQKLEGSPTYSITSKTLVKELASYVSRRVQIEAEDSRLKTQWMLGEFETQDKDIIYLANISDSEASYTLSYTDGYQGIVTVYRPLDGGITAVPMTGGSTTISVPGYQAVLVVRDHVNDHRDNHVAFVPTPVDPSTQPVTEETETAKEPTESAPSYETSLPEESMTQPTSTGEAPHEGCTSLLGGGAVLISLISGALLLSRRKRRIK